MTPEEKTQKWEAHPFERALTQMKEGKEVKNLLWNGKGMSVFLQKATPESKMNRDYLCMKIVKEGDVDVYIPWIPSQQDLLRGEWILI